MNLKPHQPRFRKIFWLLGGSVFGIFSLAVVLGISIFRMEVREQVLQRDRQLLHNVAQHLYETLDPVGIPEWDLLELAVDSSSIKGVIAVRLFQPDGQRMGQVPESLFSVTLSETDRIHLRQGFSRIRYHPDFHLDALFTDSGFVTGPNEVTLLEILVPLRDPSGEVAAIIQYWLDGTEAAEQFGGIDRYLLSMGSAFIAGGGLIFAAVFLLARNRLVGMARIIEARNRSLETANRELARAARTSAIGSVASHLFHGLKNPLAGLKTYLRVTAGDQEALAITDRMQSLIEESLSVIREETRTDGSSLSVIQFAELARQRLTPNPGKPGQLRIKATGEAEIPAHKAQLLLLIIRNLTENALEASDSSQPVDVDLQTAGESIVIRIRDRGPGLPDSVRQHLFEPVTSHKPTGTGIGLAISAILARHVPADLALDSSDENGTTFRLSAPLNL
jgi:signal transduction histidine kinase